MRELARQIQEMRRLGGLYPKDFIIIYLNADDKYLKEIILRWRKNLASDVGAKTIEFVGAVKYGFLIDRHFDVDNKSVWIGIKKG